MSLVSARTYFEALSTALMALEVTDADGAPLSLDEGLARTLSLLASVRTTQKKTMVIGNGGSAAIATHVHNDLCKTVGVRALSFTDLPLLTALSNDCGYNSVYVKPLELWAESGDMLIAISSSGQSENILRAAAAAASRGCHVVTLSGFGADNRLRHMGALNFYVPSRVYGYVELAHAALAHYLTDTAVATTAAIF